VNGGESTSQYHTPLAVAKFTGNKIKSSYFITTPSISAKLAVLTDSNFNLYTRQKFYDDSFC
jgi:hypothetical protein